MTTTPSWDFHGAKAPSFFPRSILVEAKTIPQGPLVTWSTREMPNLVFESRCRLLHRFIPPWECRTSNAFSSKIMAQDPHLPPLLESWWKSWGVGVSTVVGRTDADASPDSNTADLSSIPGRRPTSPTGHHFIFSKSQFGPYLGMPRKPRETKSSPHRLHRNWCTTQISGFIFVSS